MADKHELNEGFCANCGKELEFEDVGLIVASDIRNYALCIECANPLMSSIQYNQNLTEAGEWNFTLEGEWNMVDEE